MTSSEETDKRELWSEKSRRSKPVRGTSLFVFIYCLCFSFFSGTSISEMLIKLQNLMKFCIVLACSYSPVCVVTSLRQQLVHLYHAVFLYLYLYIFVTIFSLSDLCYNQAKIVFCLYMLY